MKLTGGIFNERDDKAVKLASQSLIFHQLNQYFSGTIMLAGTGWRI